MHPDERVDAAGRRPAGPAVWVLAGLAVLLVTTLAVLGARSGPWVPPAAADAPATTTAAPVAVPGQQLPPAVTRSAAPTPSPTVVDSGVLTWIVVGTVLALVVAGLVLLAAGLLHRPMWRRRTPALDGVPLAAADEPERALPRAVDRALDAVEDPDAREAVVQAWLLLGRAAAGSGTPPRPAETAAEYARRLAVERGLPGDAVGALAELYREARFSTHEVRPEQRDEARGHLLTLRTALSTSPAPRGRR